MVQWRELICQTNDVKWFAVCTTNDGIEMSCVVSEASIRASTVNCTALSFMYHVFEEINKVRRSTGYKINTIHTDRRLW